MGEADGGGRAVLMVRLKVVPTQSKENCSTYKTPDLFPGSEESQLTLFVVTLNC